MKFIMIAAAAAALTLSTLFAGAASAQASTTYRAGACTARGQFATCVAGGNATRPSTMYVHVHANAGQWVTVYWSDVCSKGTGAGSRSGHFRLWLKANRTMRHAIPHPYTRPSSCSVAADTQIHKGTYLHIYNTYHRW